MGFTGSQPCTVITFGTFDCLHKGHIRIFERIKASFPSCRLVVGVSSDALNISKKSRAPVIPQEDRVYMVESVKYVDEVFLEESLELKVDYCLKFGAELLIMGDDHRGKFDFVEEGTSGKCKVQYLERTPSVSTTAIIETVLVSHSY